MQYLSRIVDSINLPVWKLEILTIMGMWPNQGHAGIVLHLVQRSPRLHELFITNEVTTSSDGIYLRSTYMLLYQHQFTLSYINQEIK